MVKLNTKAISLNTIDLKDKTFLLSYGYDLSPLKQSIKQVGLLNPPVVRKKSDGTHQIICGYKRVRVLKELGISSFPCSFVPAKTGSKESLLLSLYDNSSHREFNLVEKSMAVNRLQNYYSEEEIVNSFLPVLRLHPHHTQLRTIVPLCRLEREAKNGLIEGTISEQTALALSQMDRESRRALCVFLISLRLSVSGQAEILENVSEIAVREYQTVKMVLTTPEITSFLENEKLNQPQKGEAIRNCFRGRRYPQLTKKEKEFKGNLTQLKLHPRIHLKPPPFFEGAHYHLSFPFKDSGEFRKILQELESLLNNQALLNILEG